MKTNSSNREGRRLESDAKVTLAAQLSKRARENTEKNPAAVALGKLGGLKGGRARAASLTVEQRREIARKAAAARWGKK